MRLGLDRGNAAHRIRPAALAGSLEADLQSILRLLALFYP